MDTSVTTAAPRPLPSDRGADPDPGRAEVAYNTYFRELSSLQGELRARTAPADPNTLEITFETPDLRRLADNVLREGVVGADLVLNAPAGDLTPPSEPGRFAWYDSPSAIARSVAAMPGVVNYHYAGHNGRYMVFETTTPEVARHLDGLVTPRIGNSTVYFLPAPQPGTKP
jgi:hypothetical protein